MLLVVARRTISALFVMLFVVTVVFVLMRTLGDPAAVNLGDAATADQVAAFQRSHGLDRPIFVQWIDYVVGVAQGDWGDSYRYDRPAMEFVLERVPASLTLIAWTMLFTVVIGVPVGVLAGLRPNGPIDTISRVVAVVGTSAPVFWAGILLIVIFAVGLHWLPAAGTGTWRHLVLPVAALTFYSIPLVMRVARASIVEVMGQDFIRAARARGISEWRLVSTHALRNAAVPIITLLAFQVAHLIGGTIIAEQVFAQAGLGQLAINSIRQLDFPVIQAFVALVAGTIVAINWLVDLSYQVIDPRIRVA